MNYGDIIWGLILIFFGSMLLISNYVGWSVWTVIWTYWPLILIIIGFWLVIKGRKK